MRNGREELVPNLPATGDNGQIWVEEQPSQVMELSALVPFALLRPSDQMKRCEVLRVGGWLSETQQIPDDTLIVEENGRAE